MTSNIDLLIADDHGILREGVKELLKRSKRYNVIGEVSNGKELIDFYFSRKVDLVLSDIEMNHTNGIEALKTIIKRDTKAKFLFLSMYTDEETIYLVSKAGGRGLIGKDHLMKDLIFALDLVENDGYYFNNIDQDKVDEIKKKYEVIYNQANIDRVGTLTKKEEKILQLVGQGLTSNAIAEKLFVSRRTVDTHRYNIMKKFNLLTLPEFITFAAKYYFSLKKH